jgi:tetratricopeptide (TPR) repeat protein
MNPPNAAGQIQQANELEREAHRLRTAGKIDQAFQTFDRAAKLFQDAEEHLKAAVCYASAATCWNIHTGWQPLKNAATRNEFAAVQAFQAKDYGYAEALFNEAALLYEKEGDYTKYSYCYVRAKDSRLFHTWNILTHRGLEEGGMSAAQATMPFLKRAGLAVRCLMTSLNRVVWGYGERPFRALAIGAGVIAASAVLYYFSRLLAGPNMTGNISFGDSLYFSIITYTTVGFGDFLPTGWIRAVAALEALAGILVTPLFLISLARRYLRINK